MKSIFVIEIEIFIDRKLKYRERLLKPYGTIEN